MSVTPGYGQSINDTKALLKELFEDRDYRTDIRPVKNQADALMVGRVIFEMYAHCNKMVFFTYMREMRAQKNLRFKQSDQGLCCLHTDALDSAEYINTYSS